MIISRYLVIGKQRNSKPTARLTATTPMLAGGEIAIHLDIDVPDELFVKPRLSASIQVPAGSVTAPIITAEVVDNIQQAMYKTLGIDLAISIPDIEYKSTGERT